ncbi:MAG TPA: hypothetical protein VGG23_10195, partial [Acidimicrobiales bacterium]
NDPRQEWRRLFSEVLGTFFLVLVAAGAGMMAHAFPGVITRTDAVVAPALMVMAITLFMGKVIRSKGDSDDPLDRSSMAPLEPGPTRPAQ